MKTKLHILLWVIMVSLLLSVSSWIILQNRLPGYLENKYNTEVSCERRRTGIYKCVAVNGNVSEVQKAAAKIIGTSIAIQVTLVIALIIVSRINPSKQKKS